MLGTGTGSSGRTARRRAMTDKNMTNTARRLHSAKREIFCSRRPKKLCPASGKKKATTPKTTVRAAETMTTVRVRVVDGAASAVISEKLYDRGRGVRAITMI